MPCRKLRCIFYVSCFSFSGDVSSFRRNQTRTVFGGKGEPGMKGMKGEPGYHGDRGYPGSDGRPVSREWQCGSSSLACLAKE